MVGEETIDFLRNGFPYMLVLLLLVNPALGQSFKLDKMIQYDLNQINYGCHSKTTSLNMEARALNNTFNFRNAVLTRMTDLTIDKFTDISKSAGGLIVLLPKSMLELSQEVREQIYDVEKFMLDHQELTIPVYFLKYSEEFEGLIGDISNNLATTSSVTSALSDIVDKVSANIYQVVVSGASASPKKESQISILQGELLPFKSAVTNQLKDDKLPVIVVNVGFKHFGITNIETPAYDTTVFLTIVDLFSKLYNQMSAKYKLVFVLHEGSSLLNYLGLKRWVDIATEDVHIQNADFAICLDSFADFSDTIYLQVSKPPKKDSAVEKFWKILEKKAKVAGRNVEINHQKINLQQPFSKWPHERFSLKRMSAMTLTSVKDNEHPVRTTIFSENSKNSSVLEANSELDDKMMDNLLTNTKILAESLASYIFANTEEDEEIFTITEQTIAPYIAPRSLQRSANVKMAFEKNLKNVKHIVEKADQREPEFTFYDGDEATLSIHNVKPAIFDLFLTFAISAYLYVIYLLVIYFPNVYGFFQKLHHAPGATTTNGVKKNH